MLCLIAGVTGCGSALGLDFSGAGVGPIPDDNSTGLDVSFAASGLSGPLGHVALSLSLAHTRVGDLRAVLTSPGGVAHLVVFSRTGSHRDGNAGGDANLGGTYVFDDAAGNDWWGTAAPLATDAVIPPGSYRTSTEGRPGLSDQGGCATYLRGAFGNLTPAQSNGTWTLNLADLAAGETGSVSAAVLTLEVDDAIFGSGYEAGEPLIRPLGGSPVRGNCRPALLDFTGTGLSSYVILHPSNNGANANIVWTIQDNDGTGTGAQQTFTFGRASDTFIDGDFDGDGIRDAAFFRPSTGTWQVRRSSRPTDAVLGATFGSSGDDATQVGDYDGDGLADFALYHDGATSSDPSHTLILLSRTGTVRDLVTGEGGAVDSAAGGVDYNGDGRADVAIQAPDTSVPVPYPGAFRIYDGVTGALLDSFDLGGAGDFVVCGNYAGDARYDVTTAGGALFSIGWTTRDSATGVIQPTVGLGTPGVDQPIAGDYDGDGLDDYAVWHPDAVAGQSKFRIRRSTSPAPLLEVPLGQDGDTPLGFSRVH